MVANSRPTSYVQEVLPAIPAGTNKEPATDGSLALGPAYTCVAYTVQLCKVPQATR